MWLSQLCLSSFCLGWHWPAGAISCRVRCQIYPEELRPYWCKRGLWISHSPKPLSYASFATTGGYWEPPDWPFSPTLRSLPVSSAARTHYTLKAPAMASISISTDSACASRTAGPHPSHRHCAQNRCFQRHNPPMIALHLSQSHRNYQGTSAAGLGSWTDQLTFGTSQTMSHHRTQGSTQFESWWSFSPPDRICHVKHSRCSQLALRNVTLCSNLQELSGQLFYWVSVLWK